MWRACTTRHPTSKASQRVRKPIEKAFGWAKSAAGLRKTRHRGLGRVSWFTNTMGAHKLVSLHKRLAETV